MEHSIGQPSYSVADDGQLFLKYSFIVSGLYVLELGFSKLKDFCSIMGKLSYLLPNKNESIFEGTVTAHLPFIGYTKQSIIVEGGLFHLRLETAADYIFFFEVCENKFSVSVDLETFNPPKNLIDG